MQAGTIIFEALTLALIIFGALAIMVIRRGRSAHGNIPAGLFLRFTLFFFVSALAAVTLGALLRPFGFLWFALAGALLLYLAARAGRLFLSGPARGAPVKEQDGRA